MCMNKFETIVKVIDDRFGEGYAKEHPELVGSATIADSLYSIIEGMQSAIVSVGSLSNALLSLKEEHE